MENLKNLFFVQDDSSYFSRMPSTQSEAIESEEVAKNQWDDWNKEFPANLFKVDIDTNILSIYDLVNGEWDWKPINKVYFTVRRWLNVHYPKYAIMKNGIFTKYEDALQFIEENKPVAVDWKFYTFDALKAKLANQIELEEEERKASFV